MKTKFDYEAKIWGENKIEPSPFYIQGLKLKYLLEDLKDKKGKLLDVGCGGGNIAKAVKRFRPDLQIHGVDVSKKAIQTASKNPQGVQFKLGSSDKLPYKNNSFDIVCMFDVLEHVDENIALGEVKRILKKDGIFHIFLPLDGQPGTLNHFLYKLGWESKNKQTGHIKIYSDRSAIKLFERNGFKVVKKRFSFHYFFSLFDVAYFSFLDIIGKKAPASIEGMIAGKKRNPFVFLPNLFYRLVVSLGHFESIFMAKIPSGGGHYTLIKGQK